MPRPVGPTWYFIHFTAAALKAGPQQLNCCRRRSSGPLRRHSGVDVHTNRAISTGSPPSPIFISPATVQVRAPLHDSPITIVVVGCLPFFHGGVCLGTIRDSATLFSELLTRQHSTPRSAPLLRLPTLPLIITALQLIRRVSIAQRKHLFCPSSRLRNTCHHGLAY